MTKTEIRETALGLPARDRLELAEELWESLEGEDFPLHGWQRQELDRRLDALEESPEEGTTWETVEGRVWPSRR